MADSPIVPVPAPWTLKGTAYIVDYSAKAGVLPDLAYSPLEANSSFASAESGDYTGGRGQYHIIRYTDTPVGPYDEFIIVPGKFKYEVEDGGKRTTKESFRVTRIYVSQKYTCWNGRKNWNIPKHLARFEFKDLPDGGTQVKVFPNDTTGDATESQASETPLFQAVMKPISWTPYFPLSSSWTKFVGMDFSLVQPPLPEGKGSQGELPGTNQWAKIAPSQTTKKACLCWCDVAQKDEEGNLHAQYENFWPDSGRWQVAVKLEDFALTFDESTNWDAPSSKI